VGKSTLFNALTASKNAEAANFPFCTIDPNIGIVDVVDERLDQLTKLSNSKKKIYTNITFVDIAGLVKGASKGEGLGNKFLSHIREVDAIIHLVRCFESDKITHINSKINPLDDLETIKTEIILSDLDIIQKKLEKGKKKLLEEKEIKILEDKLKKLNDGNEVVANDKDEAKFLSTLGLLSIKPKIIVCNVDEGSLAKGNFLTESVKKNYPEEKVITICADIEDQIMGLDKIERETFMREIGLNKTGLNQLIKEGYELLKLDTFFTSGPEESRAWTVEKNTPAPKAASVIHTDFEKNFIRAETVTLKIL
jgi:GTP-binding protein YchF